MLLHRPCVAHDASITYGSEEEQIGKQVTRIVPALATRR